MPEQSRRVAAKLHTHPLFQKAHKILIYNALWDEVNVLDGYDLSHTDKTFILPTVVGDGLELHRFTYGTQTRIGAFGITESLGETETDYDSIDLAIIPGRAFTPDGRRLGRGKGYYDRLLPTLHCPTIGVCYPFQLLDDIPTEPHDHTVDEVITTEQ